MTIHGESTTHASKWPRLVLVLIFLLALGVVAVTVVRFGRAISDHNDPEQGRKIQAKIDSLEPPAGATKEGVFISDRVGLDLSPYGYFRSRTQASAEDAYAAWTKVMQAAGYQLKTAVGPHWGYFVGPAGGVQIQCVDTAPPASPSTAPSSTDPTSSLCEVEV